MVVGVRWAHLLIGCGFPTQHSSTVYRGGPEKRKISWVKTPFWCQRSEENEEHLWKYNVSDLEADGFQHQETTQGLPLPWAKSRKLRLQLAGAHQKWTIEEKSCLVWWALLHEYLEDRVRIELKHHESMEPSSLCQWLKCRWWYNGGGDTRSFVADHIHPLITTVYSSSDCCFQQDNTWRHKASVISSWFLEQKDSLSLKGLRSNQI